MPDIVRLRRFSLTVGLILLAFAIAGQDFSSYEASLGPIRLPLVLTPLLIAVSLVLASLYSTARYGYYSLVLTVSPMRARRLLKERGVTALRPDLDLVPGTLTQIQHDQIREIVNRYFPRIEKSQYTLVGDNEWGRRVVINSVSKKTLWWMYVENLDYTLPLWLNTLAILIFVVRYPF